MLCSPLASLAALTSSERVTTIQNRTPSEDFHGSLETLGGLLLRGEQLPDDLRLVALLGLETCLQSFAYFLFRIFAPVDFDQ